jgi:hypothetical protein
VEEKDKEQREEDDLYVVCLFFKGFYAILMIGVMFT